MLPAVSRTRTPSLVGRRPPVSTSVPSFDDFSTNLPIASINAGGGGDSRYDSEWRMNVRYFMAPPLGFRSCDERARTGSTCQQRFFGAGTVVARKLLFIQAFILEYRTVYGPVPQSSLIVASGLNPSG